jgi:predicted secreted hydrolase
MGAAEGADGGEEYGFEYVFFRAVRGSRPPGYAAHFAVTDLPRRQFRYDQRQDVALNETAKPAVVPAAAPAGTPPPGLVSLGSPAGGFDLALGGWRMRGLNGRDALTAAMPGYAIDLQLTAQRPVALHLGEPPLQPGLISFGPAGYSYYYSRTRMDVAGTLALDGGPARPVRGQAWMDHQWGDFLVLGGGGWDWFSGQLADGRDVTISLVRDASGATILAYGTLVAPDGEARHLPSSSFAVSPTGTWQSPHTGIRYPSGWRVRVADAGIDLLWTPLLADQEFDARASSGVIYWEGAVDLRDAATGAAAGRGYVELTGYTAPSPA